ncbi:MAG: helix-turn-helix transcriptional regulator [Dechloromonas sp.]|nr:helix-turn-helix transcriptional regulator [Dechloromonas sp.]
MNQSVSIGDRLREERQRLDLNQTQLGEQGGVTKKTQMLYEAGERFPDAAYLASIAEAGADIRYIVTGLREGPAPESLSTDERELLALFRAAPLAVKAAAIGALQGGSSKPGKTQKQMNVSVGTNHGQIIKGGQVNHGPLNFGSKPDKK